MNITKSFLLSLFSLILFAACDTEDPGPVQNTTKEYAVLDFDQLEIGNGLNIRVEEANTFLIRAEGDRRNIHDLEVFKSGTTLVIRYDEQSERNHQTYLTIGMPHLKKVNFSGGCVSVVSGFESDGSLDFILSGGSVSQLDAGYRELNVIISGASKLKLHGLGDALQADISGASLLSAFDYPVRDANIELSGASNAKLTVSDQLNVHAEGASAVEYRGNPQVNSTLSGASTVVRNQ